jgi:hypothetical protein
MPAPRDHVKLSVCDPRHQHRIELIQLRARFGTSIFDTSGDMSSKIEAEGCARVASRDPEMLSFTI